MPRNPRNEFLSGLADFVSNGLSGLSADRPAAGAGRGKESPADFLRRARREVESGLDRSSFGVEDLACALQISPRQLRRRIQEGSRQSPVQFIRSIRLERARSLIEDGRQSIGDVAQSVNISSLSYFARCFREEFGLNPSEYQSGAST